MRNLLKQTAEHFDARAMDDEAFAALVTTLRSLSAWVAATEDRLANLSRIVLADAKDPNADRS